MVAKLHVVGVRHHSPACARVVAHVIDKTRPEFVLIEGPSDMNGRIDELLLGHELPFAIFSFAQGERVHHASWSPFCAYSPEWVAIVEAKRANVRETLFIDLPAWDEAFLDVENRYSDRHTRPRVGVAQRRMDHLCEQLGVEDTDALWDHLFEQPLDAEELATRLATYFRELREGDEALGRDVTREAYMSRWIAWALAEDQGDVVVVCGGYHAPMLEALARERPADVSRPHLPKDSDGVRTGSYLVPYSFHRLDSFVGYESGMPSPEFYQRVWEDGAGVAGEAMLFRAITHLREKKQRVSPADAIAAMTLARGISSLRGHTELGRVDVLDGLAAAIVKDALDAPLPWNRRGQLLRRTDPMLVEIVAAFSGERIGKLAQGTPHPPLVADALAELTRVGVSLERVKRDVTIPLTDAAGLDRSRVLHRLRVLHIPGVSIGRYASFERDKTELSETWQVSRVLELEPALIEAAMYGATLEAAASSKLEAALTSETGVVTLTKLLREATYVGIGSLASRLAATVRHAADVEPSFADLGAALTELVGLHEHDVLFGAKDSSLIGETITAAFDRGLWLFEGIDGGAGLPEIRGALALRDTLARVGAKLGLDGGHADAVMHRRTVDHDAPPGIRGAAFGFLWSRATEAAVRDEGVRAIRSAGRPETLGDFLSGLFALAREEVARTPDLMQVIDALITPMTREDFLIAIPSLRMAFAWFPPREREAIASLMLERHGGGGSARDFVRLSVQPEVTIAGLKIDGEVAALAERYGLRDALDDEGGGSRHE